jgi:hypothetical protein
MARHTHHGGVHRGLRQALAGRRRTLAVALGLALAFALGTPLYLRHRTFVEAWLVGRVDAAGRPRYTPPYPEDDPTDADLAVALGRHVPTWTVGLARARRAGDPRLAEVGWRPLRSALAPDRNLSSLFAQAHRDLLRDPEGRLPRLDWFLWAVNHYLDGRAPWRLEGTMVSTEDGPVLRLRTYRVDYDSGAAPRLRYLTRVDRIRGREARLGHTTRQAGGAMVLLHRTFVFTVDVVWPALDPALDARRPARQRPWLTGVRQEVQALLSQEDYAALALSAPDRQTLLEMERQIRERPGCEAPPNLRVPALGLPATRRAALREAFHAAGPAPEEEAACSALSLDEVMLLLSASERLRGMRARLRPALEALAAVVARTVAVHELRHALDFEEGNACPGCPEAVTGVVRDEVSAYLASLAFEGVGYLALLQACALPEDRRVAGGALAAVLDAILPLGCAGPTRYDLYDFAQRWQTHLFGERPAPVLPADLPERVAVLPPDPEPEEDHDAP